MINVEYQKVLLGYHNNEPIYLSPPSWDCGWYWGFGYLGNKNCHYHVNGLAKNCDLHQGFINHFGESFIIRTSQIWTFAELFQSFYDLKKAAEVLNRGGFHLSTNPCSLIIKNADEVDRINKIVLPAIFKEIYKIIDENLNNKELFDKLVYINNQGDTKAVVDFINEYNIKTDDLKSIKEMTNHDFNVIHTYYWQEFHKNKTK